MGNVSFNSECISARTRWELTALPRTSSWIWGKDRRDREGTQREVRESERKWEGVRGKGDVRKTGTSVSGFGQLLSGSRRSLS